QQHRFVPGQHDHRRAETQPTRARAKPGQQVEGSRHLAVASEVMFDNKSAVKASASASMLYSMKSRKPSLLSNSGPPRLAAALPKRPNCIFPASSASALGPQFFCGQPRALGECGQLGPHDARVDFAGGRKARKAAIGAGDDPLAPDDLCKPPDALRDCLRM